MIACKNCKFLQIVEERTYPPHNSYFCGAAIEDEEYMKEFKKKNHGLDLNYINKVLGELSPDWCPCKENFITEEECRIVVGSVKGVVKEVKDVS